MEALRRLKASLCPSRGGGFRYLFLPLVSAVSQVTEPLRAPLRTCEGARVKKVQKKKYHVKIVLISGSHWRVSGTPGVHREPHTGNPSFVPVELLPLPPSP